MKLPKPLGLVLEEGQGGRGVYVVSPCTAQRSSVPAAERRGQGATDGLAACGARNALAVRALVDKPSLGTVDGAGEGWAGHVTCTRCAVTGSQGVPGWPPSTSA